MTITPDTLAAMRARANVSSAVMPAMARDIHTLAAEVERLQALLAPTRGDLLVAYASAGAARVEAGEALQRARSAFKQAPTDARGQALLAAEERATAAQADEAAKRAALDAFERAHGLDLTHAAADAAEPCPGSRGW
jgi:hypothetical protein